MLQFFFLLTNSIPIPLTSQTHKLIGMFSQGHRHPSRETQASELLSDWMSLDILGVSASKKLYLVPLSILIHNRISGIQLQTPLHQVLFSILRWDEWLLWSHRLRGDLAPRLLGVWSIFVNLHRKWFWEVKTHSWVAAASSSCNEAALEYFTQAVLTGRWKH